MNVIDAIKFMQEHYDEVDPNYIQAQLTHKLLQQGVTPEDVLGILMQPKEETEEYSNEEWVEMVEKERDPLEAAWLIIEWIWTRRNGRDDSRAMKEYLACEPGEREYESPAGRVFERPQKVVTAGGGRSAKLPPHRARQQSSTARCPRTDC